MIQKMKKIILLSGTLLVSIVGALLINTDLIAEDIYYTNKNGVDFTKDEYDFLSKMYWEGSQELMTKENHDALVDSNLVYGDFDSVSIDMPSRDTSTFSYIETQSGTLTLSRSCTSDCLVSLTFAWKGIPSALGYDVMGVILENTERLGIPNTIVTGTSSSVISHYYKYFTNGFGVSFELPSKQTARANMSFYAKPGGTVYGSYQHAMRNTSLANSQKYTLSRIGYGGVFWFDESVRENYDALNGLFIDL